MSVEKYREGSRLKLPPSIWRFDSQHEFKVYLQLCRMYGKDRIVRQYPIAIVPPSCCYPSGKVWRVDFAIRSGISPYNPMLYLEAKGAFLTEFACVLSALEQYNIRKFYKVRIVFARELLVRNKVVKALLKSDFSKNLITLNELKKLKAL